MQELQKALKQAPIVYVTRDIERALGLPAGRHGLPKAYQNYHIITNSGAHAKEETKTRLNILLIKDTKQLDTRELLAHPKTKAYVNKLKNPRVVVFKNTTQIEKLCAENGWALLNPPAALANRVEEKISQLQWLGELTKYLPPHRVMVLKDLTSATTPHPSLVRRGGQLSPSAREGAQGEWELPFVLQFNRAHTGSGTILIESEKQLNELKKQFPNREVRVTQYISGPAFTNNNVVWGKKVLIGNINYQITGLSPFTARPFATIGNDWRLSHELLTKKQQIQYRRIATDVGKKLAKDGWKGLFGIDVIQDEATGKLYLIEINARQPASTTFESQLQELPPRGGRSPKRPGGVTTFEAHLASLVGLPATSYKLQAITNGAQVVLKNKEKRIKSNELNRIVKNLKFKIKNLKLIAYDNTGPESDLLRIQSNKGVMEKHGEFNRLGLRIVEDLN